MHATFNTLKKLTIACILVQHVHYQIEQNFKSENKGDFSTLLGRVGSHEKKIGIYGEIDYQ